MKTRINLLKPFLLIAFIFALSTVCMAQRNVDIVKLKNGNVLKGKIVRQVMNDFVELKTIDNNFWKFDMEDVAEIQYSRKRNSFNKYVTDTIVPKKSGLFYEMYLGVLAGNNENANNAPLSFINQFTLRTNKGFSLGVGAGYEAFDNAQIPVFGELKIHSKFNKTSCYLYCMGGWIFPIDEDHYEGYYFNGANEIDAKTGWMINPGIGIKLAQMRSSALHLRVGYRYQKREYEWMNTYTNDQEKYKEDIKRLSLHLGIVF